VRYAFFRKQPYLKQRIFFSGLNGLRAIAALAVVFSHITQGLHEFGLNQFVFGTYADGNPKATLLAGFGVSIFFTLSGFLITYLLLEEKQTGNINVRHFYIRRILRIWPLYYLYLILSIVSAFLFDIPLENISILFYVFLLANVPFIFGGVLPFLGHYWSLGVEEQFYSFWPWVIKKSNSILKTAVILCFGLITLKIIIRLIDIKTHNGDTSLLYNTLHVTRFHCMLIGAIGAILYYQKNTLFLKFTNNLFTQCFAWLIILLVAINKFHVVSFMDNELISVISLSLIIGQIQKSKRIINLNISFFDFIGKISYGIYVIHPLVIFYLSKIIILSDQTDIYNYIFVYGSVFAVTIGLSYISYSYFEKYFLNMKDKYSTVKSSGTMRYPQR
jgi:peptidoglycan/LPS O-acetylase OafA/YrhL